jgi:hypothetical protein
MSDKAVGLLEGSFIEKKLDALTGRHLAFFVLSLAAFLSPAFLRQLVAAFQFLQFLLKVHGRGL